MAIIVHRFSIVRKLSVLALLVSSLCALLLDLADAAHSRRRMTVVRTSEPRYDRSITTFDPSGRLIQVEYGMQAASRGANVLASLVNNNTAIVLVVQGSSQYKVHRVADHVWMVTTGLSGDARALAGSLRTYSQRYMLNMGEVPTIRQVAQQAALLQHQLTRTGGARPLGCTAIVIGADSTNEEADESESSGEEYRLGPQPGLGGDCLRIFRTDPGGILEDCRYCAAGRDQDALMKALSEAFSALHVKESSEERAGVAKHAPAASAMVGVIADTIPDGKKDSTADVWSFRPSFGSRRRRGNLATTCFLNVPCNARDATAALSSAIAERATD